MFVTTPPKGTKHQANHLGRRHHRQTVSIIPLENKTKKEERKTFFKTIKTTSLLFDNGFQTFVPLLPSNSARKQRTKVCGICVNPVCCELFAGPYGPFARFDIAPISGSEQTKSECLWIRSNHFLFLFNLVWINWNVPQTLSSWSHCF